VFKVLSASSSIWSWKRNDKGGAAESLTDEITTHTQNPSQHTHNNHEIESTNEARKSEQFSHQIIVDFERKS
jgi:hypothetical protein